MKSSSRTTIGFVLLLTAAVGGWFFWKRQMKEGGGDPHYRTNVVSRGDVIQTVTANGALNPVRIVSVGSQISGIINDIRADFNDRVTTNQVLANIDPSTYERDLASADADLSNSRAALELAQFNYERDRQLFQTKTLSESDYKASLVAMHQAESAVKMKEAARERAKVELDYTTIKTPIAGVVISRAVEAGQTVAASFSTPELFQIAADLTKMQILALVSEADVGGIHEGEAVTFAVDAYPGRQFEGVVSQVRYAPVTNQNVVSYSTVVSVSNPDLKLFPGMTANASIVTASRTNTIRVPNAALRFRPASTATIAATNGLPVKPGGPEPAASGEPPTPPWVAEGRRPTEEERRKFEDSLTPGQLAQYRQARERMRAMRGSGGDGGGGGGTGTPRPARTSDRPQIRTIYTINATLSTPTKTVLDAVRVRLGISDGSFTEVIEGLKEGDVVVTGSDVVDISTAGPRAGNPFGGGPFGGGMRR